MRFYTFILCILISFAAMAKATPTASKTADIIKENHADIERIEKHLNSITTLKANFEQEDSEGVRATGMFYLSRPGRLRWDYAPPVPILIVAKGSLVAYYDKELDQLSHVSIDDTLAGILTQQNISFSNEDIQITGFSKKNNEISIRLLQKHKEEQGNLTMIFNAENLDLTRMEVVDAIGKQTKIFFKTPTYNASLENNLFVFPRVQTKLKR